MSTQPFNFNMDLGGINGMLAALSARFPQLLDAKVREAEMGPDMLQRGFKEHLASRDLERRIAKADWLERATASRAAQALADRDSRFQQRQYNDARADEDTFVNAETERMAGLARRYGGGPINVGAVRSPAMLAIRGKLGGTAYRGAELDDDLGNPTARQQGSDAFRAQACRVNPAGPGCPKANGM